MYAYTQMIVGKRNFLTSTSGNYDQSAVAFYKDVDELANCFNRTALPSSQRVLQNSETSCRRAKKFPSLHHRKEGWPRE